MRGLLVMMAACALGACGDDGGGEPAGAVADARGALGSTVATPARPDDPIVARVGGRPIYGSCVEAQRKPAAIGLQECIDFELLAMAAEAKGLAADPEVIAATRDALVSRFVEREFEATYRDPASMRTELDTVLARDPRPAEQPERRGSAYARVDVAKDAPPAAEAAAKAAAAAIAADVVGQAGLSPAHLTAAGERHTAGTALKLTHADVKPMAFASIDPPYAEALFALPEIGRAAGPVRTAFGWDVILLTSIEPAYTLTREARVAELFPKLRRQQFNLWVQQLAREQRIQVVLDPKHVAEVLAASEGGS